MTRTRHRIRTSLTAGLLGVGALGLRPAPAPPASTAAKAGSAKVPLVVYSAQGYDHAMTAAFTKATGIPVKLDDNSTGPLLTQIEASKNNPNWGLLWVDGATAFAGLDQQGLLQKGYEPKVTFNSLGQQSLPADKSYTPTGVTMVAAVVYNSAKVKTPPTSFQQLLSPQWKGQVGMNDPAQSGPTYPLIAGMMNKLGGISPGRDVLQRPEGQRAGHPPDQRPHPAGPDQRADQRRAGAELGRRRRRAQRQEAGRDLPEPGHAAAERHRHRRQGARGEQRRGGEVRGVRPVAGRPEGDADRRPDRRLAVLPGGGGVTPLAGLPPLTSVTTQTINPYTWGSREAQINTWFDANIVR